jgi:hypothetical protein
VWGPPAAGPPRGGTEAGGAVGVRSGRCTCALVTCSRSPVVPSNVVYSRSRGDEIGACRFGVVESGED